MPGDRPSASAIPDRVAPTLIETAVESLTAAVASERAGVDRIELCDNLDDGGTTPMSELIDAVLDHVRIPVFVMVRPRAGDFVYSTNEQAAMRRKLAAIARHRVAGIVTGGITSDDRVDTTLVRTMIESAGRIPVTFHRAFDTLTDHHRALDDLVELGVARILTAGAERRAVAGSARIADLVSYAKDRITIVAGGGVRANNVTELLQRTGVSEIHSRFVNEAGLKQLVRTVRTC